MNPNRSCAVVCGMDEEYASSPLYPCCGANGHFVHIECLARILETNDEPVCPVCRDPFLKIIKDLCVKNPEVNDTDDDDDDDPEWDEVTEIDEDNVYVGLIQENKTLRDTLYALANQYRTDHDRITRCPHQYP